MRGKYRPHHILEVVLLFIALAGFSASNSKANENRKYLDAVREFADNVLKYGRDTYGPKHTPLFVDGLNIYNHKPVEWIAPNGDRWILSNLASQQNLFRTLDGLSRITGDPKYKQAAMEAIEYGFENLRHPNSLFYWGHATVYDAGADDIRYGLKIRGDGVHSFKLDYPYYELMWEVNSKETKRFIEAFWSAHIIDWSNLDFDRYALFNDALEEPWNHEYKRGPTFIESKKSDSAAGTWTGTSLIHAGTTLYTLSGEKQPLIWSKRLAERFIDTRHPKTGISYESYNYRLHQLGDDLKEHFNDPYTRIFPQESFDINLYYYYGENVTTYAWMSMLLAGEMLAQEGKEFKQWALEEFTAQGNASYRKKDNSFVPILTDGTSLEGYVWKEAPGTGSEGLVVKPCPADMSFFWAYSVAYRITGDEFMWEMVRNIALGNNFGDIGQTSAHIPELQTETSCSDVYGLLGFLQLHEKTNKPEYLNMARRIGDNILLNQFYKGFFVPSKKHIYTRFDCSKPLVLLHLDAAMKNKTGLVPRVWPSVPLFIPPYRYKEKGNDRIMIYTLTESSEPPLSLQEAAAIGDVEMMRALIDNGTDVDSVEDSYLNTALHCATMSGHKDVAELLIAEGAYVNARTTGYSTPLHYAAQRGRMEIAELLIAKGADVNARNAAGHTPLHHVDRTRNAGKDIIELLIAKGADVNAKNAAGDTPLYLAARTGRKDVAELLIANGADVNAKNDEGHTLVDVALSRNRSEVVKLLIAKGADVSFHQAARFGALAKVKSLIEGVADINEKDASGQTPLHYAAEYDHRDIAELLIAKGADVNVKNKDGNTPGHVALSENHSAVLDLLIAKGANLASIHLSAYQGDLDKVRSFIEKGIGVNAMDSYGATPLHYAAARGNKEMVEFLFARGAHVNAKNKNDATPAHFAAGEGHKDIVQIFIANGADVNAKDQWGYTPLRYAVGQEAVAELLIAKGADVNVKDIWGFTPLHDAVGDGQEAVVRLLFTNGADVNARNKWGRTPLDIAVDRGHTEIVELLRKHGAKE